MFILEKLISVFAPHLCIGCGDEGMIVCAWCLPELFTPLPSRCYMCKTQTQDSLVCSGCRSHGRLKHLWAHTSYEDHAKQLVHGLKFERKQAAVEPMARLIAETLPFLAPDTIITHVPTATSRIRQRGYDHAELLAKALAAELGLTHVPLLRRVGQARQVGSTRAERLRQLENVFHPAAPKQIQGVKVLLVDDLVTTGGTLACAAKALREAGAKSVSAAVFAQKQ